MVQRSQGPNDETPSPRVVFGKRAALEQALKKNTVLIVPSADRFNDFGLHSRIDCRIKTPDGITVDVSGHIGFLRKAEENGNQELTQIVERSGFSTVTTSSVHQFFIMLSDMESYRSVVRQLGVDQAGVFLNAANDLVALGEFDPRSKRLEQAVKTQIFVRSFMRNAEAFFAFKNAGSILRGLSEENLRVISSTIAIRFQLAGRDNEHDFTFHFDHDGVLPKRIAIVIGENGVGKSQTLGRIAKAAIGGGKGLTDGSAGGRPLINRLLAFAPTNEAESVFPSESRKRSRIWYQRFSLNRSRRSRRNEYVSDLVVQVARSPQTIGEHFRWEIFREAIQAISAHNQIHLVSPDSPNGYVPLVEIDAGSEQRKLDRFGSIDVRKEPVRIISGKAFPLSSGEISFLKFAAQASLSIENGSLLLLDEPETHLHPTFISRFVSLLDRLLELTGSAAIIATHSVYFVREVFREQVSVLRLVEGKSVRIDRPVLRTFGADVGAISYFVFGEDEPSKLAERAIHKLLSPGATWGAVYQQYKDELSLEALNDVRAVIGAKDEP